VAPSTAALSNPPICLASEWGAEAVADAPRSDTGALLLIEELSVVQAQSDMVNLAYHRDRP
jgi:hypothetical protein